MLNIKYNIATNKKVDYKKLAISSSAILVVSLIFVYFSIGKLWSSDSKVQEKERRLRESESRIVALNQELREYRKGIKIIKSKWQRKVNFANSLIKGKKIALVNRLDILEKLLPEGVFILYVKLDVKSKAMVQIKIAANSLPRLMDAYDNFSAYQPIIKEETEGEGGLFTAEVSLRK